MIYSDRQCGVSERELANLKSALAATEAQPTDDEWLRELEIEGLKSQIAEIEADISRYNMLKSGDKPHAKSFSLDDLPRVLIEARIASGMSQSELAAVLGVQPQRIQRDEASNYAGASLDRLISISKALNLHAVGKLEAESDCRFRGVRTNDSASCQVSWR